MATDKPSPPLKRPVSQRTRLCFEELEPRLLFSADPLLLPMLGPELMHASLPVMEQVLAMPDAAPQVHTTPSTQAAQTKPGTSQPAALELVFVDARVPDSQQLVQLIAQQAAEAGRMVQIHELSADQSGVAQISQWLAGADDIAAVHIISHGSDGSLLLGNTTLDSNKLPVHAGELSAWGASLRSDADILLYGCDVAATSLGQSFLSDLALLTGADVAASDDLTGATTLGGDWDLEYRIGDIGSPLAVAPQAQAAWQHVLATATFQEGVGGYSGTQDTYIDKNAASTSNANSTSLKVDDGTPNDQQTLIRFDDIIGVGKIPLGSTITSATLTVYVSNHDTADTVTIHKMLVNWSEGSTYNSLTNGVSANNIEADSAGLYTLDAGISGAADFTGLASSIQDWANGGSNNGWVILTGDANADNWVIDSSEAASSAQHPLLTVVYTAPTPPSIDLDANNSSGATGSSHSTSFTENGAAVNIADSDASVTAGSNTISTSLTSMTVTISNLLDGTAESLAANTGGTNISASYNSGTGVLSLTGTDSAANYQTVLRSITYNNTSDNPSTTSRVITVVATDPYGGNSSTATSTVSINAVNDQVPVITSNGAGASASINIAENIATVTTVTATDGDSASLTYSISGGVDAGLFSINSSSGVLTFLSAPDYETPLDVGSNNVYDVIVRVSDGSLTDTQALTITVTDEVTTLVVDTTADTNDTGMGTGFTAEQLNGNKGADGKVSLREAIIAANNSFGTNLISFNMSSGAGSYGEYTITTASSLPNITDAVYINGATQSGYANLPLIVLDGDGASGDGLYLSNTADGSTIRGLLIRDFSSNGIYVQAGSDNNLIVGNLIGSFNADGSNAGAGERNSSEGIESYGANLTVGGTTAADRNVISGNTSAYNIYLATGSNGSVIQGNYIGTDAAGTSVFSSTNSAYGVMVESPATNITIGGTASGAGNVISGFTSRGIWATTTGATTIQGNRIGTDYTGTLDLGNAGYGIYIDDAGSAVIGGTSSYAGNVISGNDAGGIRALNTGSVTVLGNIIGLNASGTAALGNTGPGIDLSTSSASTIGGNGSASRNIISGNSGYGIEVSSSGHTIKGNYIGVAADGSTLIGNGSAGIYIAASNTTVGGKTSGDGNVIAGNGGDGIVVASGNGNLFYRNAIYSNTGLGIDLSDNGVSLNDLNDADGGGNYQNNFPVITSVVTNGVNTTITGSIEWATESQPVYIEFFSNPSADASGHGEGRTYLGYVQLTTNATTGDATFSTTLTGVSVGDWITAIANIEGGPSGASEFALSVQAVAPANAPRGRVIWNNNDQFYQRYADWSSTGFGGTGVNGLNFGDDISMILAAEAPTRDEIIFIGSSDVSGEIQAGIWNGSSWSSIISIPVASPSATASQYNSFAVAYDEVSGNAMLIWDNGNTGTTGLSYAIWDGSSWSATNTITAPISGEPVHMKLAASHTSSEMTLAVATTAASNNQYAIVWSGSSWGNAQTLGSNSSKQYFEINVVYEQQSGQAMVIYDASASNSSSVQYRVWDGASWSSEGTVTAPVGLTAASELHTTVIASDPTSDRIALAAKNAAHEVWLAVWDGSSWGSTQVATTSGVTLPDYHATMDVAFESQSGDLMAAYGKTTGPNVYYRTWTSGGGWSAENTGPSVSGGNVPYVLKLYADPYSDTIMMGAQDSGGDLNLVAWNGSAWGTPTELDDSTAFTYRENFTYVWYRQETVINNLNGDTASYTEGSAAVVIDQSTGASVTLGDGSGFDGGALTVSFAAGSTSSEDILGIRNQGSGAGQIGVSGSNVTYAGVVIGSYTGGSGGAALVFSFNSNATDAAVGALIQNITYLNSNTAAPSTVDRTVRFVVTSAQGRSSANNDITLGVIGVNDAPAITSNGGGASASINVAENSTAVTTVSATDVDGPSLSYSIIGGADAASFNINASTGALSFASAPNHEAPTDAGGDRVYDVIVQVSDGSLSDSQTIAVTVTDIDEFDVGSVSDTNGGANAIAENAANGSTVGVTASALDADGSNNTITYSLSDSAGGRFTINTSTGVVTVADGSLLNYEAATSHSITVLASGSDGSSNSQSFTINVSDVDEFDVGAVIDTNGGANAIAENAANGSTVGVTASALDADGSNNTITYSLSDSAGGRFTINTSTGVVTVADGSLLNYEAATSYSITVLASGSDGSSNSQSFTINVSDVDEFDVGSVVDTNGGANAITENAANGSTVGVTASALDADGSNNTITYSLSDSAGGRFTINTSTGVVTVADGSLLNYEAATSHSITVLASGSDGSSNSQSFTVNVSDIDEFDVGSVMDANGSANAIAENAANGSTVGVTASALDADGSNNTITYSLSDSAGGRFAINTSTGVVTVADGSLLNYETATSHNIIVLASSSDGSSNSQSFTINVSDVDEFDVGSVSDTNAAANAIAENAANGSTVGVIASASDADGSNNTITYSLADSAGGRFTINTSTGVVTVADGSLLNYEAATSHNITVLASSSDGSSNSQSFTINVSDVDEFDVGAVIDTNGGANAIAENAANGSTVGVTASALDADASNNTITYSLSDSAGGRFTINASTGVVTVADGSLLNYEAATSHNITVLASGSDGSSNSQSFTINVSDVDEFDVGAVIDTNGGANAIAENAANGSTVGVIASALDADGSNNTITYSLSDSAGGRFTINASTGVVTVADGSLLNFDAASSHSITVIATSADGSSNAQTLNISLLDSLVMPEAAETPASEPITTEPKEIDNLPGRELNDETPLTETRANTNEPAPGDDVVDDTPTNPSANMDPLFASTSENADQATQVGPRLSRTDLMNLSSNAGGRVTFNLDAGSSKVSGLYDSTMDLASMLQSLNQRSTLTDFSQPTTISTLTAMDLRMPMQAISPTLAAAQETQWEKFTQESVTVSSVSLSLGAVWWATRASGLITSLIITTPAWRTIDPLPVLFTRSEDSDADEDSDTHAQAEQMFEEPPRHAFDPRAIT